MNPRIQNVKPHPDYTLTLTFTNGEIRVFDMKPYLHIGIFKELRDMSLFNSVRPFLGSIRWKNGQDLCPDTLYMESQLLSYSEAIVPEQCPKDDKAAVIKG